MSKKKLILEKKRRKYALKIRKSMAKTENIVVKTDYYHMPISVRKCSNFSLSNGLVKISLVFFSVGTRPKKGAKFALAHVRDSWAVLFI